MKRRGDDSFSEIEPPGTSSLPGSRRPSDRAYFFVHLGTMGLIAGILAYAFFGAEVISTPRSVGFRLVILLILSFNVLWWSIADRRFARFVQSPRLAKGLRISVAVFTFVLNVPILTMLVIGEMPAYLNTVPTIYAIAVTLWTVAMPMAMPLVAIVRLVMMGVASLARRVVPRRVTSCKHGGYACTSEADSVVETEVDSRRRAFLKTAFASVPMTILVGGTVVAKGQEGRIEVNRHAFPSPWLPERLRGLTITHISDLHVGRLYRPSMLRELVDRANDLDSDIVVVTGDIVDISNDMLPPALHALSQLTNRHGIYLCMGNHDAIDDGAAFVRETRKRFPLLIDERRVLEIDGERITIAGVDFAGRRARFGRPMGYFEHVASTLEGHSLDRDGPVLALVHHPHAFDDLAGAGVPLTLAGHTHGGQLMLTKPGRRPDVGIGRVLFRYTSGFYRRGAATLFVNRGVGNWFPVRVNAPAEIVQIQLT